MTSATTAGAARAVAKIPPAEEAVLYEKDPKTKIATITFNRPDDLNAMSVDMRLRYADLIKRANDDKAAAK